MVAHSSSLILLLVPACKVKNPILLGQWLLCLIKVMRFVQENAAKVQKRLINKPRHPAQLAADVVERVLATDAEQYLETRMHALTWWQLSMLDVKLVLALSAAMLVALVTGLCWLIFCLVKQAVRVAFVHDSNPIRVKKTA